MAEDREGQKQAGTGDDESRNQGGDGDYAGDCFSHRYRYFAGSNAHAHCANGISIKPRSPTNIALRSIAPVAEPSSPCPLRYAIQPRFACSGGVGLPNSLRR